MYYIKIHKSIFILILFFSCTKEKILKKNEFPDNGEIFVSGFINNLNDNKIEIYGKNLLEDKLSVYIDTGLGYMPQILKYNEKEYLFEVDLTNYKFRFNKNYKFKIHTNKHNDSLIINKQLPPFFNTNYNLNQSDKKYFNCQYFISNVQNDLYYYDIVYKYPISLKDTNISSTSSNTYYSSNLPSIRSTYSFNNKLEEATTLNNINLENGIRIPHSYNYSNNCGYLSTNQKFKPLVYKFSEKDYQFINSLYDNIVNYGNPFFLFYQIKSLEESHKKKILGNIVGGTINEYKHYIHVKDYSDTILKIYINDKNGVNIFGNPRYKISYGPAYTSILELELGSNLYFCTQNSLEKTMGSCSNLPQGVNRRFLYEFRIYDNVQRKTYFTNKVELFKDNLPKTINLSF